MRRNDWWRATAAACLGLALVLGAGAQTPRPGSPSDESKPVIRVRPASPGSTVVTFEVEGLPAKALESLNKAPRKEEAWKQVFAVYVRRGAGADFRKQPPLLGSYRLGKDVLVFEPRFPLERGLHYVAVCDLSRLPGHDSAKPLVSEYFLEKPPAKPTTVVRHVYPTRNFLPANQLKFYLHFSAPMQRGDVYEHVHLLDAAGKEIEGAFLRLGEELWDPSGTRFTLFFDPGRIKRGLKPREVFGPILEEGKRYTFVIDADWPDAQGNPLKGGFRKSFRAAVEDEQPVDPRTWKLAAPAAGSKRPLTVHFGEPLDHALLERVVWVRDTNGRTVAGRVTTAEEETVWQFTPERPWERGRYELVAETILEDLAGNRIGRPFEVDVFRKVDREIKAETVQIPFEVGGPDK
jgi:hypothetical protein